MPRARLPTALFFARSAMSFSVAEIGQALHGGQADVLVVGVGGDRAQFRGLVQPLERAQPDIGVFRMTGDRGETAGLTQPVEGGQRDGSDGRRPRDLGQQPVIGGGGTGERGAISVRRGTGERHETGAGIGADLRVGIPLRQPADDVDIEQPGECGAAHARRIVVTCERAQHRLIGVREAFDR